MKSLVEKENLDIVKVVPVLAQDMDFDEEYIAKAFGLDRLIDIMSESTAVAAAFGEGFVPIPFSDATI